MVALCHLEFLFGERTSETIIMKTKEKNLFDSDFGGMPDPMLSIISVSGLDFLGGHGGH